MTTRPSPVAGPVSETFEEYIHRTLNGLPDPPTRQQIADACDLITIRHRVYALSPGRYPGDTTSRDLISSGLAVAHGLTERLEAGELLALTETYLVRAARAWQKAHRR